MRRGDRDGSLAGGGTARVRSRARCRRAARWLADHRRASLVRPTGRGPAARRPRRPHVTVGLPIRLGPRSIGPLPGGDQRFPRPARRPGGTARHGHRGVAGRLSGRPRGDPARREGRHRSHRGAVGAARRGGGTAAVRHHREQHPAGRRLDGHGLAIDHGGSGAERSDRGDRRCDSAGEAGRAGSCPTCPGRPSSAFSSARQAPDQATSSARCTARSSATRWA